MFFILPAVLVQFTDNLLNLQEGYVRQLEDKTNAKPGMLCALNIIY